MTTHASRDIRDIYPLTPMQHAMLVESLANPDAPVYLQHYDLELTGVPDAAPLRSALADLVARHDVLRTAFVWDVGDQPLQVVRAAAEVPLTVTDLRDRTDADRETAIGAALDRSRATAFDLRTAPLLRVAALRVADDRWRLVTTHHHLVLDGWSVPVLHTELVALLAARVDGRVAALPKAVRFREFVDWQRTEADPAGEERYFTDLVGDIRRPTPIGADLPRAGAGGDGTRVTVLRPVKPDDHPDRLARTSGLLPSTVVHAAWALLLARWSDVDTVVFGSTVSGRPPELAGAGERVGMFVNTAPLRIDVPRDATIGAWLADVQARLHGARRFEQAPVLTAQHHSAVPAGAALLTSVLAFQNYWRHEQDTAATGPVALAVRRRTERIDLPVAVAVALPDDGIWVRLDHDGSRIDQPEAERAAHRLAHLIATLAAVPAETRLADVALDSAESFDAVDFGAASPAVDRGIAVAAEGFRLTAVDGVAQGGELRAAANALADKLTAAGLGAGDPIGIRLPLGRATGAAILAVHRIGARPVPLDPYRSPDDLATSEVAGVIVAAPDDIPAITRVRPRLPVIPAEYEGGRNAADHPSMAVPTDVHRLVHCLELGPSDLIQVVAAPDEPALPALILAAVAAGASLHLTDPVTDPAEPTRATVVVAAPSLARRLAAAAPTARLVLLTDPPAPDLVTDLLATHRVYRLVGEAVEISDPANTLALGHHPGAVVLDRFGHPAPTDVPGELARSDAAGYRRTGMRVRMRGDDGLEQLGHGPTDDLAYVERLIATDPAVAEVALTADRHAWLVPNGPAEPDALARRLRDLLPERLRPTAYHYLAELPVDSAGRLDRAALIVDRPAPSGGRSAEAAAPTAERLHRLDPETRAAFLDRLRALAARTPGLRPTARDTDPLSAQQAQWHDQRPTGTLRATATLPVPPQWAEHTEILAAQGISNDAYRVEGGLVHLDPAGLDLASVAAISELRPMGDRPALTHADYAAWQTGPDRVAARDEQLARWRTALAGTRPLPFALDRRTEGIPAASDIQVQRAGIAGDPATWAAAAAIAVATLGGADDVVIGVQARPDLPPELAGVAGPFTRLLPIRLTVDLAAGCVFGTLVESARAALAEAARNGDVAWSDLAALLPEPPAISLAVHDMPDALAAHAGALFAVDIAPTTTTPTVDTPTTGGPFAPPDSDGTAPATTITALADPERAHPVTAARIAALIASAATIGAAEPSRPLSAADLVPNADELLGRGNAEPAIPAPFPTIPDWLHANAEQFPENVAVEAPDGALTYARLVDLADALAADLAALGVGTEDRVAVCLPRGLAMVWAPLAVMTAGAAYVPLDPLYPDERLRVICADAEVAAVVTTADLAPRFPDHRTLTIPAPDSVAAQAHPAADRSPAAQSAVMTSDAAQSDTTADRSAEPGTAARPTGGDGSTRAAYMIYTSGSTGTPKGVVVEHRAVTDFSRHIALAYGIDQTARVLGFASLTFDVSIFDLWTPLTAGATLVLAGEEERLSVDALQVLLRERRVTAAELPPSLMPLLDPTKLPDLRLVSVGGEAPAGQLVDDWATADREFWNGYGPTETTVAVTLMRCYPPSRGHVPPIGLPMTGHRVYVLDRDLRLVPDGAPGELCVSGPGLARGYFRQRTATALAFPANPYSSRPGDRLYRTGDLVRWTGDGVLEFLGRIDRQVKIRGFRVELGDVESALSTNPAIRQVVVEPWDDTSGTRHLVAYIVPTDPAEPPGLADIRDSAAITLPAYMLPTRSVAMDQLPRTRTGKIDRDALPTHLVELSAGSGASADESDDESWTDVERTLARDVIGPLLGRGGVGRVENFFQMGGNSLQATQVTARVQDRFDVTISLLDFFTEPTVAHLAELVSASTAAPATGASTAPAILMVGGAELPLSYPQRALYDAVKLDGDRPGYHAPMALRFHGPMDLDALRRSFEWLVARHAPLRVTFVERADGPIQVVQEPGPVPFDVVDVTDVGAVSELVARENTVPFDLSTGPLVRVHVYRFGPDDHVVSWNVHHMVIDGWSVGLFLRELGLAYGKHAAGELPEVPALRADYGEFISWHRDYVDSPAYERDLAWWRERLADVPTSLGPESAERPPFAHGWRNLRLPGKTAEDALATAKLGNTTLYGVLLAAWGIVLSAQYEQDDVLVVTPNALRVRSAWEGLVGWFVNRVVIRLRIPRNGTFADLVEAARMASLDAFAHGHVPFEMMRAELELPRDAVAVHLSVQNAPTSDIDFGGLNLATIPDANGRDFAPIMEVYSPVAARYQISAMIRQRGDGSLAGGFEFDGGRMSEDRASEVHAAFLAILAAGSSRPTTSIQSLRELLRP